MNRKLIIIILLAILVISAGIAVMTRPSAPNPADISYETIDAKVTKIDIRTGKSGKYTTTHYYDVYLTSGDDNYMWSTPNDPHMRVGVTYEFVLCDGRVYKTVQEMQNNIKILSSSAAFRISVPVALLSFVGIMNVALLGYMKRRKSAK